MGFKIVHALVIVIGVLGTGGEDRVESVIPYSASCWEPWDEGGDLSVSWGTDLGTQKLREGWSCSQEGTLGLMLVAVKFKMWSVRLTGCRILL